MKMQTYDIGKDKKVLGGIFEDGVYTKTVNRQKHLFRKLQAYGIQADIVARLTEAGCHTIRIKEHLENVTIIMEVPFSELADCPREFYNHGMQVFISLAKFKTVDIITKKG